MKKYIAVILMSSVLLTGCSSKITEGEIYKKDYQPEETIMIMTPMIHTNGKSSYTTYIPMFYHYPDRWCIWIKATEKNDEGNMIQRNITPQKKCTKSVILEICFLMRKIEIIKKSQ